MTTPDDVYSRAVRASLRLMGEEGPELLLELVQGRLRKAGESITADDLVELLTTGDVNAAERVAFHLTLARWDAEEEPEWSGGTDARTSERRAHILELLGFGPDQAEAITAVYPPDLSGNVEIVEPDWDPWYTQDRRAAHSFYWDEYRKVLGGKLDPAALASLDSVTTNIVSRLADPTAAEPYQSKGLVVGHVQSGKTTNFTGVVAKAIDSGYRLIIVLTGTVELLRRQTQRRLDMELIGEENILGGRDRDDPAALQDIDYAGDGDQDWADGKFVTHGDGFRDVAAIPEIRRLTGKSDDYKRLRAGLDALDFRVGNELRHPHLKVWHESNLFGTDVRIAVIKKNKAVMEKLVQDLRNVRARLDEIPTLIIDDEADQASVNTTNPRRKKTKEDSERTAINRLISQMLSEIKRSQYVGYTATPFANVFVSPDDSEDIFPKDFIISLNPPAAYMGGRDFHDLEGLEDNELGDPAVSNEAAFVRDLRADTDDADDEIRTAVDMFVLTGAIKLWREASGEAVPTRHHTMLVHESVRTAEHKVLADRIRQIFSRADYTAPATLARLRDLYRDDVVRVSGARPWNAPLPDDFRVLIAHVGEAVDRITRSGDPVTVVNGDKESEYNQVDFDKGSVWRVLVGGTKLSRGFTVEGLTVTYYRRKALAADTLMQMGRWFGYRPGYRDLVRLYIARNVQAPRGKTVDLYEAFEAIVQDEEAFRAQLQKFAALEHDGQPAVRPIHVPPLVFQQLPWLKPTSANKMYNAELDFVGEGGVLKDFPMHPERGDGTVNATHFSLVAPWIPLLGDAVQFEYLDANTQATGTFMGRTVVVTAEEMLAVLEGFEFAEVYNFQPTLEMIRRAMAEGTLTEWVVMVPDLGTPRRPAVERVVDGARVQVLRRTRRSDRAGFSGSSFRQRDAIEHIGGNEKRRGGPNAAALYGPTRGAMLLTFAADPEGDDRAPRSLSDPTVPQDIATLFSLVLPREAAPRGRIGFRVRDAKQAGVAIVPVAAAP